MRPDLFVAFVAFAIVMSVTPGPNNMMVLASGVNFGFRRTLPHMLGISAGCALMIAAIGVGIGEVFERLPWLYEVLRVASVAYMLWLAWKIATSGPIEAQAMESRRPLTSLEGAAFQWVNPKAWAMCLGAVSTYIDPARYVAGALFAAAVLLLVALPSVALWTGFGVSLRGLLADPRRVRIFNIAMALALVASLWPVLAEGH